MAIRGTSGGRLGVALVLVAAALWGTNGVLFRILGSNRGANAFTIGFLRLALSVPFLLVGARLVAGRWVAALDGPKARSLALLGAAMALYQLTYVLAIERAGVAVAVLVTMCGSPLLVALLTWLRGREKLTGWTLAALALAVAGTFLLVTGQAPARGGIDAGGVALGVAAAASQALYVISGRAVGSRAHPLHATAMGFAVGAALLLPGALVTGELARSLREGWGILLYIAIIPTALGQGLFLAALRLTSATSAAVASLAEPLVGTVLAVLFLNESMAATSIAGAALLLGAIACLERGGPPAAAQAKG